MIAALVSSHEVSNASKGTNGFLGHQAAPVKTKILKANSALVAPDARKRNSGTIESASRGRLRLLLRILSCYPLFTFGCAFSEEDDALQ